MQQEDVKRQCFTFIVCLHYYFVDFSRRNSFDFGETSRESEFVILKERKLVSTDLVYQGVSRLSFLLETCPPGSVPDAHLLTSALDLVST